MIAVNEHIYVTSDKAILNGEPIVRSTRTPVRAIVELYRMGVAPEEIPTHLPHLKLSQVFDALSYYNDNINEINSYILANKVEGNSDLSLNE